MAPILAIISLIGILVCYMLCYVYYDKSWPARLGVGFAVSFLVMLWMWPIENEKENIKTRDCIENRTDSLDNN